MNNELNCMNDVLSKNQNSEDHLYFVEIAGGNKSKIQSMDCPSCYCNKENDDYSANYTRDDYPRF